MSPIFKPLELFSEIQKIPDPFEALVDDLLTERFLEGLKRDLSPHGLSGHPNPHDIDVLLNTHPIARWFVEAIRSWSREEDAQGVEVVAVLVVASWLDVNGQVWRHVLRDIEPSSTLPVFVSERLVSFQISVMPDSTKPHRIWEAEAIAKFNEANLSRDWAGIAKGLEAIQAHIRPTKLQVQAISCVFVYDSSLAAKALDSLTQILPALQTLRGIATESQFDIAASSRNGFVQLAAAINGFTAAVCPDTLRGAHEKNVTTLLVNVAKDADQWAAWMLIFNTYPQRYRSLQEPLGAALAQVTPACVSAYIDAIKLDTTRISKEDPGGEAVAACLIAFARYASIDSRKHAWRFAHERWTRWNFGANESPTTHLISVSGSALDYALTGYALELLEPADRSALIDELMRQMQELDGIWHETKSDLYTGWYRRLSKLQIYIQADLIQFPDKWPTKRPTLVPHSCPLDGYTRLRYNVGR